MKKNISILIQYISSRFYIFYCSFLIFFHIYWFINKIQTEFIIKIQKWKYLKIKIYYIFLTKKVIQYSNLKKFIILKNNKYLLNSITKNKFILLFTFVNFNLVFYLFIFHSHSNPHPSNPNKKFFL